MKTVLKIKIIHNCSKIKQTKNEQTEKKDKLKSTQQQTGLEKNNNNKTKPTTTTTKQTNKQTKKEAKINKIKSSNY